MEHKPYGPYEAYIKRPLDFCLSLGAFIVLSPVMAVTAVLVKVKLGSPVIFRQPRPGKDEKIFNIYKFRTMTDDRDSNGELLPSDLRLTSFGKKLRATSIDELPELINIIKGDMAVVGPRPLLEKYLSLYSEEQHRRHEVRPGLTGYAQANGRNLLSWDEKFKMDLIYVENISFINDLVIILQTLISVIKRKNITNQNQGINKEFQGSNHDE